MPYEYFPAAAERPVVVAGPKPNWLLLTAAVLFLALCLAVGYIIWEKNQTIAHLQQQEDKGSTVPASIPGNNTQDSLQKELLGITARYTVLREMNTAAGGMISSRDAEINAKTNTIRELLSKADANAGELAKARQMIGLLNADIEGLKQKVEVLTGEKIVLQEEKKVAVDKTSTVQRDLDSARNLIKQKDELLETGATLSASAFSIISIQDRNSGKERSTNVAKKVDKLRISFDIDLNQIAGTGLKELFICITGPDGIPISVEALGSGKFVTRKAEEKFYTQKIDINYMEGSRQTISFDWKQNRVFEAGPYKIEVFNNGFRIGGGIRYLKKGGLFN